MSIGYRITKAAAVLHLCGADLIYPTFWFLSATQTLWLAIVFRILLIGALGINMLASTMLIVSALPRHVRATGTSMIYAFGVTLFGGSAQLIVTAAGDQRQPAGAGVVRDRHADRQSDCHFAVPGASHRIKCRQYRFCRRR